MNNAENAKRAIDNYDLSNQVNEINEMLRNRQSMKHENDRSTSKSNRETISAAELKILQQKQQEKAYQGSIQPQQKIEESYKNNSRGNSPIPTSYAPGSRYAQPVRRNTSGNYLDANGNPIWGNNDRRDDR